jgi:hypothetical protein
MITLLIGILIVLVASAAILIVAILWSAAEIGEQHRRNGDVLNK